MRDHSTIHKKRKAAQICVCAGVLVLFVFTLFFQSINAYALNVDYLEEEKWSDNKNITEEQISLSGFENNLSGIFKYYIDNSNMCIYTYFSFKESTFNENSDDVRITYNITTPDESYLVAVNKDGMCDSGKEEELFTVNQSFNVYSDIGLFISALEYEGKSPQCLIDVYLFVNGTKYIIKKDIPLQIPTEEKIQTTKERAAKKTTAKKSASKRQAKENSTKYQAKYRGTVKTADKNKYTPGDNEATYQEITTKESEPLPPQVTSSLSKSSKGLLILAGVASLSGISLLIAAAIRNKKEEQKD